jgi:hypothetical protein
MLLGMRWPWKWMPVVSSRLLVKLTRTGSPSITSRRGPGHMPLKPRASTGSFRASIRCFIVSIVMSQTFTPPSTRVGWRG